MEGLLHLIIQYRYVILLPLACFEGPIIAFLVGILTAQGYFNPFVAYGVLILGDLIPDALYYYLGRYGSHKPFVKRSIAKIGVTEEHFDVIRGLWTKHPGKTMFLSKLAYGMSTAFLISAGLVDMPAGKYFAFTLPITFSQYAIFMALGYYWSGSFNLVSTSFRDLQYIVAGVIAVGIAYYFLTRYMRRKLLQIEKEELAEEKGT